MKRAGFLLPPRCFSLLRGRSLLRARRAQGTVTFGGGASGEASPPARPVRPAHRARAGEHARARPAARRRGAPAPAKDADKEWADRDRKMNEAATLTGGVGLLHTQHAQGGAVGSVPRRLHDRVLLGRLPLHERLPVPRSRRAPAAPSRTTRRDHIGGRLTLSMQVLKWLEPYLATSAFANSNAANRPALLQVLGDSILGAKAHGALGKVFHLGGAFELCARQRHRLGRSRRRRHGREVPRARAPPISAASRSRIPLRFSLNTTYVARQQRQRRRGHREGARHVDHAHRALRPRHQPRRPLRHRARRRGLRGAGEGPPLPRVQHRDPGQPPGLPLPARTTRAATSASRTSRSRRAASRSAAASSPGSAASTCSLALDIGVSGVEQLHRRDEARGSVDALPRRGLGVRHAGSSAGHQGARRREARRGEGAGSQDPRLRPRGGQDRRASPARSSRGTTAPSSRRS